MRRDLELAYELRVPLRRLQGWEPKIRLIPDGVGFRVESEPEWDKGQYELMSAYKEYRRSTDEYGFPLEESMSIGADPNNPRGTHRYVAKPVRLWSKQALVDAQSDPKYSGENYSAARLWQVEKVER